LIIISFGYKGTTVTQIEGPKNPNPSKAELIDDELSH
jgi:hypothetical protein